METDKKQAPPLASSKKEMKKMVSGKLKESLPELKDTMGEKKFDKRIKKAAKLLTKGLFKEEKETTKAEALETSAATPAEVTVATKKAATKKAAAKAKAIKKAAHH